jgi:hypothetical protein
MDRDFLNAVKNLTITMLDFLYASDGNDDHRIEAMAEDVFVMLHRARENPALKTWAEEIEQVRQKKSDEAHCAMSACGG